MSAINIKVSPEEIQVAWDRLRLRKNPVVTMEREALVVVAPQEALRSVLGLEESMLATSLHVRRLEMQELALRIRAIRAAGEVQGRLTVRQGLELGLLAGDLAALVLAP